MLLLGTEDPGRRVGDGVLGSSYPASLDERRLRVAEQEDWHQMRGHGEDHSDWGRGLGEGSTEAHGGPSHLSHAFTVCSGASPSSCE